jgi:hypothetical protein
VLAAGLLVVHEEREALRGADLRHEGEVDPLEGVDLRQEDAVVIVVDEAASQEVVIEVDEVGFREEVVSEAGVGKGKSLVFWRAGIGESGGIYLIPCLLLLEKTEHGTYHQ